MRKRDLEQAFAAEQAAHNAALRALAEWKVRAEAAERRATAAEAELAEARDEMLRRADRDAARALELVRAPRDQYLEPATAPEPSPYVWSEDGLQQIPVEDGDFVPDELVAEYEKRLGISLGGS